jgi:hypothetical protein
MTRFTVAFADAAHAREALRFVARASLPHHAIVSRRGTGEQMAVVELEVGCVDVERFRTLVAGVHGVVMAEVRVQGVAVA